MLNVNNLTIQFGSKTLFEDVNLKFTEGNCYGIIGANGAGKSTFLKILSKEIEPTSGSVIIDKNKRLSVLEQDHFKYDNNLVLDVVLMGNKKLYDIMKEKEMIYSKPDFSDEDGIRVSYLEGEFAEMDGWNAESDAEILLNGLGIETKNHHVLMKDLDSKDKVKVLLAKTLFGNPDILILDEPTNHLDLKAKNWLEEFLINFNNTILVVSHDRYFLNKVCTHICDIDYNSIKLYPGNYDFWYESSQLLLNQMKESNKKKEEKIKELQDFIARFSANASKSKQATSRKKLLDKIELDDIKPSSRKYPYIDFKYEKKLGDYILKVDNLSKTIDGKKILDNVSFIIGKNDKVALVGSNELAKTCLLEILSGNDTNYTGEFKFGDSVKFGYFSKDHNKEFNDNKTLFEWLYDYSPIKEEAYVRGFLGRMLFSKEDPLKKIKVLSGGEKVRCLLSRLMIVGSNMLLLDDPTNHLDLESITSLNNGLIKFTGPIIFSSNDHQLIETTYNKLYEINDDGKFTEIITTYEEYLNKDN